MKTGDGGRGQSLAASTYSVVGLNEGVVDSNDIDITVLNGIAEDNAANAAEAVDASLDDHFDFFES